MKSIDSRLQKLEEKEDCTPAPLSAQLPILPHVTVTDSLGQTKKKQVIADDVKQVLAKLREDLNDKQIQSIYKACQSICFRRVQNLITTNFVKNVPSWGNLLLGFKRELINEANDRIKQQFNIDLSICADDWAVEYVVKKCYQNKHHYASRKKDERYILLHPNNQQRLTIE